MLSQTTSEPASSPVVRPIGPTRQRAVKGTWTTTIAAALSRAAPALTFVGLIAIWQIGCKVFSVPDYLLPAPSDIINGAGQQSFQTWSQQLWATLRVALMGYAAAVLISIPTAMALASSKLLSRMIYPIIVVIHSMPIVAIAPIIVVTLGASDLPRVVITFLISFFPIVVTTTAGLLATPDELIELSRSLRASKRREMLNIRLLYALPYIFSALKVATTLSIVGAVVAEFVAAEHGLGYFIQFSTSFFKISQSFFALAILVALSLTFFSLVSLIQRMFAPWSLPRSER